MNKDNEKHFGLHVDGDILPNFDMYAAMLAVPPIVRSSS